ncbi:MAG: hypothetical protein LUF89_03865 [Ruminococcus sp.]|nr:hypothetical protein [Ruminococcus sp.]
MDQKNLFDRNQGTQSSYTNFTTVSSMPVCDARNDSTSIVSSNKTAVEANPIQQAYNSTYPNFEINLSRNLQISVDETADFNHLCPLMQNFNGISAKEKVDYTKLGMAVVNEFSDKGIHANVSVNLSTTVSIDLFSSNMNAEQIDPKENVIDVSLEE